ncbi:hypothetical protein N5I15_12420 [Acinetobacter johnsonii]|uniref:hypothetical protein n=1 Tax=Acinetobacter TaxID=469 RepID=UPI00073D4238|nr:MULTISPECIES: hypothetical protein [Acinetobacter]ALV71922.1 hypothetical protein RZ95_02700 [Acinetobacter johnsonii XBB1]MCV2451178.1 hypothetical protein [Acinetobacter johnsonii]MDH1533151.1 hypothetical protein [Acinetobacter johnsonii]
MKLFLANSRVVKCSVKDLMKYQNVESILAEDISENNDVLSYAIECWIGYGLIYPKIENIKLDDLSKIIPKVFLLRNDDNNIKFFKNFGHVLFDFKEYEKEVFLLKNYGSY